MKKTILTLLCLCSFSFTAFAQTDPETAANTMLARFMTAMTNADTATVTSLFSDDALFWGTSSQALVTDPDGVQAYFGPVGNNEPGQTLCRALDYSIQVVSADLALLSGLWEIVPPGQDSIALRLSMAIAKRDCDWKIIQFHNSAVPR